MSLSDFDRPLNKRGMANGEFMSDLLSKKIKSVDAFFSSSSKRTILTSKFFINKIKVNKERIYYDENLYHASYNYLIEFISADLSNERCVLQESTFNRVTNFLLSNHVKLLEVSHLRGSALFKNTLI